MQSSVNTDMAALTGRAALETTVAAVTVVGADAVLFALLIHKTPSTIKHVIVLSLNN